MTPRSLAAVTAFAICSMLASASRAQTDQTAPRSFTPEISATRVQIRPAAEALPVPLGFTKEQILHGDRVFHGEAAGGQCSSCHGIDAKGTPTGSDLTTGMYIWGDGSVREIKRTIMHNMAIAPGMDGNLRPEDVDAVAAYIWALGRQYQ